MTHKTTVKIVAIIVTYRTPSSEVEKLSHELQVKFNASTIIVDNTIHNEGFAAAVNKGLSRGLTQKADLFIICNPDISLKSGDQTFLSEAARHFDIFSGVMIQSGHKYYGGKIDYWTMGGGLSSCEPSNEFTSCDFVSGSFMCITKKAIDTIGMFSLKYFLYYEDTDYCLRASKNGLRVGIIKKIVFKHQEKSKSFAQKEYYLARNRLRFLFTHGSLMHKAREIVRLPFLFLRLYLHKSSSNSLQLQGYIDFLYGKEISH